MDKVEFMINTKSVSATVDIRIKEEDKFCAVSENLSPS